MTWGQRCLPNTYLSTVGLLALCYKWGLAEQQGGGLGGDNPLEAALLFARSSLSVYKAPQFNNLMITVALDSQWKCMWPRPQQSIDNDGVVGLGWSNGQLNLAPLIARAKGSNFVSS